MTTSQMELVMDLGLRTMTDNFTQAIRALRDGNIILLLDTHDRENEGDLIVAAEKITPESMNFLIKKGSGVVCLALSKKHLDHLGLPLMIPDNTNFFQTAFTVSIEASKGVTTGVSAKDRTHTILVAMADEAKSSDLARPGHVFPLASRLNGVFDRMGHTEGSVDIMRIAGLKPGAVLCELMNEDGSMTVGEDRIKFAKAHNIPVVSVEEVLFYRMHSEDVFKKSVKQLSTRFGALTWHRFNFFDAIVVDVFHKLDFVPSDMSATRIARASGDNQANRFLAQVLDHAEDDPLVGALMDVSTDRRDLAIMCTSHEKLGINKTGQELTLRQNAAICRVLKELEVNHIDSSTVDEEISRIARNYFAINLR